MFDNLTQEEFSAISLSIRKDLEEAKGKVRYWYNKILQGRCRSEQETAEKQFTYWKDRAKELIDLHCNLIETHIEESRTK